MSRPLLDVESPEDRASRLGNLFTSLSQPADDAAPAPPPGFPLPPSRPHAVPESDALARARAFLPLMAASNADLLARAAADPESVVVEGGGPGADGKVVAMDVGLGMFDAPGAAGAAGDEMGDRLGPVVERDEAVWARAAAEAEAEDEEAEDLDLDAEGESEDAIGETDEGESESDSDDDDDDDDKADAKMAETA